MTDQSQTSRPPRVYPRLNQRLRIAMWLAFVGGPVFTAVASYQYYGMLKLAKHGVQVAGTVIHSNATNTGKGRTAYHITVEYVPEGRPKHRKDFNVSEATFATATRDGQIPVVYLPTDPTVSEVGGKPTPRLEPFAIGGGLLLFSAFVWFYLKRVRARVQAYVVGEA